MRLVEAIVAWDDDDTPCPFCGEAGCERSCTGAILTDEAEEED
jgi:hypothetical protein